MRRLPLLLVLALSACTLSAPGGGGEAAPVATEEISVTPLAPPGAAAEAPTDEAPADSVAAAAADAPSAAEAPADAGAEGASEAAPDPEAKSAAAPESEAAAGEEAAVPPPPPLSPEAQACMRRKGTWAKAPSGGEVCIRPTRDGGKSCTRESQCESLCLARSGTCAPITPVFGCNEIFQNDGLRVTLCLD